MRVPVCVLILAACALADDNQNRRYKLPFIADAVGNTLPPPSNVPATVGSPVNLLTPDRYEFYTFDESGELVKRLMTLEEIQAIVAAGEESEGLVTFANDNQPTIAIDFSQPPYTKVHSVVTNVQNVLKAQMEAHKNKPSTQPPLDTPDVSDSWSLILPSIFGNTGVDIMPDKTSGSFITPETETIELDTSNFEDENSLGKEGINLIVSSSTTETYEKTEKIPLNGEIPDKIKIPTDTTTTTIKPTSTVRSTTDTKKRVPTTTTTTSTTTAKPRTTTTSTTFRPRTTTTTTTSTTTTTTTTNKPRTTTTSTTFRPRITTTLTTTAKPRITPTTTTVRSTSIITTTTKSKPTLTTIRPQRTTPTQFRHTSSSTISLSSEKPSMPAVSTKRPTITTSKTTVLDDSSEVPHTIPLTFGAVLDSRKPVQYEKISTFVPTSTYVTAKTTGRPLVTTKVTPTTTTKHTTILSTTSVSMDQQTTDRPQNSTSSYLTAAASEQEFDKINSTTITTQSVSPSTTVSSTEFITINDQQTHSKSEAAIQSENDSHFEKDNEPVLPLFDVAQSISQIASDLGGNYAPLPTNSNLLDNTKVHNTEMESKENIEIDIPPDGENDQKTKNSSSSDYFVKIPTLYPQEKNGNKTHANDGIENENVKKESLQKQSSSTSTTTTSSSTTTTSTTTTIDPILFESMEDLLSQVVHSAPESIVNPDKKHEILKEDNSQLTTEKNLQEQAIETSSERVNKTKSQSQSQNVMAVIKESNEIPLTVNHTNDIEVQHKEKLETNLKNESSNSNENVITEFKDKIQNNELLVSSNNSLKMEPAHESFEQKNLTQTSNNGNEKIVIISTTINDKEVSISSTESLPKLQSTTMTLGSTIRQKNETVPFNSEKSKLSSSSEINRISYVHQKEKESVVFPKVDEFKKKIQKVNIDDKELASENNNSWKLISTMSPSKASDTGKDKNKNDEANNAELNYDKNIILDFSKENQGLEVTTKDLGEDIAQFTELCNELAFQYWSSIAKDLDKKRSFVLSPYSITSMLAMMFMGARGSTSGEMNEILKLDDMVTFNPHFTLKNISDSIETSSGSGVAISAFIRELYSDRSKGKILTFYKERAQHFYNGHVEEINFKLISDVIRRRTNLLVKRYTWGKIMEYMKTNTITMHPPLAAYSANIFQTDCSSSSVEGRDGEMYFVVSPNVRQRRLVPVPAVVYRSNFLAGYDPVLDATAAALGNTNSIISTLFLMPGQQGNIVHAEDLETLEKRLLDSSPTTPAWNRLLRTLLPRVGLELQIPRFSHKSIFNVSSTLRRMGLKDLFDKDHADLAGLNGPSKDLYLSDMIQTTTIVTCGEGVISEQHHIEEYPESLESTQSSRTARWITGWDEPRDYQRAFHDPHDVGDAMHLPLHLRPRQARLPSRNAQPARLKFDRPFLFFVRHNPSGMILYVGRYNPRLLP